MPSYAQFIASLHEKYLLFSPQLDYFTAGSLFPSVSRCTFLKACASTAEMPFQQLHCSCSKTQPHQTPVLESPKASLLSPANFAQPPREKPKSSKDHTNEIYGRCPWKCQSRVISEILIFTFSSSSMKASKENREQLFKILLPAHSSHGHKSSSLGFLQT